MPASMTQVTSEAFIPLHSVMAEFQKGQLSVRKFCSHKSCRKDNMPFGNIMPLTFLEVLHPNHHESVEFRNFCPMKNCNHIVEELADTPNY